MDPSGDGPGERHPLSGTSPPQTAAPADPAPATTHTHCRRLDKIQGFFGPGIVALLCPTDQGQDVALVCDGSGSGRGGDAKKDVLPPLMPGMKPRQQ